MAWTNFRLADDTGIGRFLNAAALLAVYPGECCTSTNLLEGDFGAPGVALVRLGRTTVRGEGTFSEYRFLGDCYA